MGKKIIQEANMDGIDFMIVPDKYKKICKNEPNAYKKYAHNAMGMYYKIMKCNELKCEYEKEHGFEYDIVIRARLDFIWNKEINIPIFNNIKNEIFLMKDDYVRSSSLITNDKFFAGTSQTMNEFTNLFKNIQYLYKKNVPIQGSDLNEFFLKNFDNKLIGDKFYYNKYFDYLFKNPDKIIFIEINNDSNLYLCEKFLKNNYKVFGTSDHKYLKCYHNYFQIQKIDYNKNYDYIILNEFDNKIKNYYLLDFKNIYKANKDYYNLIQITCEITHETFNLKNRCNIQDLTSFVYYNIISNNTNYYQINGSINIIPKINDTVIFDTFINSNKVRKYPYYKITNIANNLMYFELIENIYNDYELKCIYKDIIYNTLNISQKHMIEFINLSDKFHNKKIPSVFM